MYFSDGQMVTFQNMSFGDGQKVTFLNMSFGNRQMVTFRNMSREIVFSEVHTRRTSKICVPSQKAHF